MSLLLLWNARPSTATETLQGTQRGQKNMQVRISGKNFIELLP